MEYILTHRTTYQYSEPVSVSHHAARLEPLKNTHQSYSDFRLQVFPEPAIRSVRRDYFGNSVTTFSIRQLHRRMETVAKSRVSVRLQTPPVPNLSPNWESVVQKFSDPVSPEDVGAYEFCLDSPMIRPSRVLADIARPCFPAKTPLLVGVSNLMRFIYEEFEFDPVATEVATPLEEVCEKRKGVCQDFAHVALGCLRSLGLPARYVSGYLRTIPPPGKPRLEGADASHAWFSAFCPVNGWVDFDPTNNLIPSDEHLTVAVGRDYSDVSPLSGILTGGGEHTVSVAVDVLPLS
ncbi:MAG: transglutaminase family protein [Verrucomicrobiota bacterium]